MNGYRYHNPGAPLYVCEACGVLVEETDRDLHDAFHDTLAALADAIDDHPGSHVVWDPRVWRGLGTGRSPAP